jgi:hypothetical protein
MNVQRGVHGRIGAGTLGTLGTPSIVNGKQRPHFPVPRWGRREVQHPFPSNSPNVPIMDFHDGDIPNHKTDSVVPTVPSIPNKCVARVTV